MQQDVVMFALISILLLNINFIHSNILEAENNFEKPKLERNNIVNKGIWVRSKFQDNVMDKGTLGDFLFRPNSLDADNILQNNFELFDGNYQNMPFVSSYFERARRSINHKRKRRPRKSMKHCKNKIDCAKPVGTEDSINSVGAKVLANLKPSTVSNEFPYEVAVLINDNKINNDEEIINNINTTSNDNINANITEPILKEIQEERSTVLNTTKNIILNKKDDTIQLKYNKTEDDNNANKISYNVTIPKRNKKHDYYNDEIKNIEFVEDFNRTDGKYPVFKTDRGIFDQQKSWNTNGYPHESNVYKIIPKMESVTERSKPVTERGLIKVISMLTKTFKKVMKHHNEIKDIHNKLINMNDDFIKHLDIINEKFQSFEDKHTVIMKFDKKLKEFDKYLKSKEDNFIKMQQDMSKNLLEFENQQKNFLNQQRQFYTIQKLMLAQHEKINIKQNLIAKTQSEIAHRQNNFARILKKAKQIYFEGKTPATTLNAYITKPKDFNFQKQTTTTPTPITESIKINLFSIPANTNKLEIKDDLIIKEKDEKPIDDLVYKYYFNNTFIDNLIKSKIFTNVNTSPDELYPKSKSKRNGLDTTLLLPIKASKTSNRLKRSAAIDIFKATDIESYISTQVSTYDMLADSKSSLLTSTTLPTITKQEIELESNQQLPTRLKRWINHTSKKIHKHHHDKPHYLNKNHKKSEHINSIIPVHSNTSKDLANNESMDPFKNMATKFCVEIGQNVTAQVLSWCVEKALRRLQFIDTNYIAVPPSVMTEVPEGNGNTKTVKVTKEPEKTDIVAKLTEPPMLKITPTYTVITEAAYVSPMYQITNPESQTFFPDNEELESNLKEFELLPDTEGNFYYDGSLHASDVIVGRDSGSSSDILPGFESNSQMDVDPYALYIQAMRRASVRRINENILKNMKI